MSKEELLDELEKELIKITELDEEDTEKNKVDRRKAASLILLTTLGYVEGLHSQGVNSIVTLAKKRGLLKGVKVTDAREVVDNFNKTLKKRKKDVNYGRMVRRQARIYSNQLKKEGIVTALKKTRNRVNNILRNEGRYFQDRGKEFSGKVVKKLTGKTVTKVWVWGKYGKPKEPRETHQQAHGQRVLVNDNFIVGGKSVKMPRTFGEPSEDVNCRCGINIEIF